jgi:mannose-6-phosphate isomerase-like protein (cupin superfamily)
MQEGWSSDELAKVNGNSVRVRTMEKFCAPWHVHADSDEFFYVISGQFCLDIDERTIELHAGQHAVVPAGCRHRGRTDQRTTLLVVDRIS